LSEISGHKRETDHRCFVDNSAESVIVGLDHLRLFRHAYAMDDGCEVEMEFEAERSVALIYTVALPIRETEPLLVACISYLPGDSRRKLKRPSVSEVADLVVAVSSLASRTTASGKTAAVGSSATPVNAPVEGVWQWAGQESNKAFVRATRRRSVQRHRSQSYGGCELLFTSDLPLYGVTSAARSAFVRRTNLAESCCR
jgi:hypothetical protein